MNGISFEQQQLNRKRYQQNANSNTKNSYGIHGNKRQTNKDCFDTKIYTVKTDNVINLFGTVKLTIQESNDHKHSQMLWKVRDFTQKFQERALEQETISCFVNLNTQDYRLFTLYNTALERIRVVLLLNDIKDLQLKINKKGSRKDKNEKRKQIIKDIKDELFSRLYTAATTYWNLEDFNYTDNEITEVYNRFVGTL